MSKPLYTEHDTCDQKLSDLDLIKAQSFSETGTKFLDFPIILLSRTENIYRKIENILLYGLYSLFDSILVKHKGYSVLEFPVTEYLIKKDNIYSIITEIRKYLGFWRQFTQIDYNIEYLNKEITTFRMLKEFVENYEIKNGKDAIASIHAQFIFQVRYSELLDYEGKFGYKDLAVLSAISSKLGKTASYKLITLEEIMFRSYGYKSEKIFLEEIGAPPLNSEYHRTRRIVKKLCDHNFFSCLTYRNRMTYYSTRLNIDELGQAIINVKTPKEEKELRRKKLEKEISYSGNKKKETMS